MGYDPHEQAKKLEESGFWRVLREPNLDLTPLDLGEEFCAPCNSNYWLISYAKYSIVYNDEGFHLSEKESLKDPRVTRRVWWCPQCMKHIDYPSPWHIATSWETHLYRVVMERKKP